MNNSTESKKYHQQVKIARRCHECNAEAFGRCPDCGMGFCEEHFPKQQHTPCAEKQMKLSHEQVCYVCGTPVCPDQWSVSHTSHYIDQATCDGCGRYICDDLHTQNKSEEVTIAREGLRGHRYQYITRYCDLCYPLRSVGGIKRVAQAVVAIGTVILGVFFYLHP
jgi:hypothetical protein